MKIIDVSKQLQFQRSNGKVDLKKASRIVVHHDAVYVNSNGYNTLERLKLEAKAHIAKGYGHISYHYAIDNVGDVYKLISEDEVAYHCGNLGINKSSLAVCLHGNFEVQSPTKKQLTALAGFLKWITTERPDIPKIVKSSIRGHREIKSTACPGMNLFPTVVKLRK